MIAEFLGGAEVPQYYMDASRTEDDPHTMVSEAFDRGQGGIYDLRRP